RRLRALRSRFAHASGRNVSEGHLMNACFVTLFALTLVVASPSFSIVTAQAPAASPYPVTAGKAFKFEKVADGVYYATSAGTMSTGSNIPVVVNDRDVLIVDTGTTPAAARA